MPRRKQKASPKPTTEYLEPDVKPTEEEMLSFLIGLCKSLEIKEVPTLQTVKSGHIRHIATQRMLQLFQ